MSEVSDLVMAAPKHHAKRDESNIAQITAGAEYQIKIAHVIHPRTYSKLCPAGSTDPQLCRSPL